MSSRAARYARYLPASKLEISLFPFLSIFLCVMGVLSFINILSSVSTPQKIKMTMELEQGYKVAFQVFTLPDGVISVPPVNRLRDLRQRLDSPELQNRLTEIIHRRQMVINNVRASLSSPDSISQEPDVEEILSWMQEIRLVNEIALTINFLYEEFILFGVYPNGGQAYQKVRRIMGGSTDALSISIGLEPLDSNWSLSLHGNKQQAGATQ